MKKRVVYFFLLVGMAFSAHAATRGDVKVLEAADTIKYRINDLTKNYLLFTKFPHKRELSLALHHDLTALGKSFQEIALTTRDTRTKGLLTYFAYQKARLEVILGQHPSEKQASEIMNMSESLVEGAEAIARHHRYDFSLEEKMFKVTLSMSEHLEAIAKYYLAHGLAKNDSEILRKISRATKTFTKELEEITHYQYTGQKETKDRESILSTWRTLEPYINQVKKEDSLPMVVSTGVTHINALLQNLGIYHSKNQ